MEVLYVDHMGSDLSVLMAAVVSNDRWDVSKYKSEGGGLTKAGKSLINFLARGCTGAEWNNLVSSLGGDNAEEILKDVKRMPSHWTPFAQTAVKITVKAPIFVARQLHKHQVGMVVNEVSRRYVDSQPEFYTPDVVRNKAEDKKQGSGGVNPQVGKFDFYQSYAVAFETYNSMIALGVCPEQARMVLPLSMYTEWSCTGNLYAFSQLFNTRTRSDTQEETRTVAHMIGDVVKPIFPESWEALTSA